MLFQAVLAYLLTLFGVAIMQRRLIIRTLQYAALVVFMAGLLAMLFIPGALSRGLFFCVAIPCAILCCLFARWLGERNGRPRQPGDFSNDVDSDATVIAKGYGSSYWP